MLLTLFDTFKSVSIIIILLGLLALKQTPESWKYWATVSHYEFQSISINKVIAEWLINLSEQNVEGNSWNWLNEKGEERQDFIFNRGRRVWSPNRGRRKCCEFPMFNGSHAEWNECCLSGGKSQTDSFSPSKHQEQKFLTFA